MSARTNPRPARNRLRFALALLLACGWLLLSAAAAFAHAQLLGTSPISGSTVQSQPKQVIFEFNQDVGGTFGAVRVYDSQGSEVDNLEVTHPDVNEHWMGVGLKPGLPDGTYTATYRVISADTHIVYGGLVFNLGHASASSKVTVAGLISRNETGHVTKVAFGVVHALDYLTIALMAGGLLFLLALWPRALAASGAAAEGASRADAAFTARLLRMLALAVLAGIVASLAGVLLQGASAAGVSLWTSLKAQIIESTLETRFGWVWGVRALVWLLLGAALAVRRATRPGALRRAAEAALVLGTSYLVMTPALAGHASIESPVAVFFPSDVVHVAAACAWVGGIACLLFVLPAATRTLASGQRGPLLLATMSAFSPLALGAVVAIAATGVIQAYIDVRSLHGLLHTTYGALVILKTVLLLGLIGLAWTNRERVIPGLGRLASGSAGTGGIGRLARRTLRSELAAMVAVLGVTAALISYAPPIDAANGPFSANTTLGPALLEMTVEPARVGANTIHLYLIDAKTGTQFTGTKELVVTARLPSKGIGPLPLHAYLAGPGHYVLDSAVLSPDGTWKLQFVDRVSEFEEFTRVLNVPIR